MQLAPLVRLALLVLLVRREFRVLPERLALPAPLVRRGRRVTASLVTRVTMVTLRSRASIMSMASMDMTA